MMKALVEKIRINKILEIGLYILLFLLLIGKLVTISYGVENINLIRVFQDDEAFAVRNVLYNLENNDVNPRGFYQYGYLYHTIGFYLIKILEYFDFKVDAMLVILVLRLISLIFYALAGLVIYKIYTICFRGTKEFGLILVLLFLSIPSFSYWGRHAHPDTVQLALILLAVLAAFSKHNAANVILGSALAGMAFGTKYSGIFIFPFLFLPYFLYSGITSPKNKKFWLKLISVFLLAVLIFLIMWIITNPYVLQDFDEFQKDLSTAKKNRAKGLGSPGFNNSLLWFVLLWNQLGLLNSIVVIAGIAIALGSLFIIAKKHGLKKFIIDHCNINLLITLLYITASFAFLMIEVNMRRPRYLFHILPFILVIAIYAWERISCLLKRRLIKQSIIIVLFILASFLTWDTVGNPSRDTRKYDHENIKAGNFLAENQKGNLKILADPYSYVPPKFKHTIIGWGMDEAQIKHYRPDIIILNIKIRRSKSWKKKGTSFKMLKFYKGSSANSMHYYKFLEKLFSPNSQWKILYETDNIVILNKKRRFREDGWKKRKT